MCFNKKTKQQMQNQGFVEGIDRLLDLVYSLNPITIDVLSDIVNHIKRCEVGDAEIHNHIAEAHDTTAEDVDEQSQATTAAGEESSQNYFGGQ